MKKLNAPLKKDKIRDILVEIFMQIIDQDRLIERQKISLAQHSDFNLFDAFAIFDQMGRGSLSQNEFYNGLANNLEIVPSPDELDLLFSRFDSDKDCRLKFSEFCQLFLPLDPSHNNLLNMRQSNHRYGGFARERPQLAFVPLTLLNLKDLIKSQFRMVVHLENLRQ